ncbi:hypothetical protein B0H19DRAFT_1256421 [Mycena capillaripes]|nr:hypothetical protein B0H19DRAFT_1256421 [Mycena capillaripes]
MPHTPEPNAQYSWTNAGSPLPPDQHEHNARPRKTRRDVINGGIPSITKNDHPIKAARDLGKRRRGSDATRESLKRPFRASPHLAESSLASHTTLKWLLSCGVILSLTNPSLRLLLPPHVVTSRVMGGGVAPRVADGVVSVSPANAREDSKPNLSLPRGALVQLMLCNENNDDDSLARCAARSFRLFEYPLAFSITSVVARSFAHNGFLTPDLARMHCLIIVATLSLSLLYP